MPLTADELRTDSRVAPLGIDNPVPEFSWLPVTDDDDVGQAAFAIEVSPSENFGAETVWCSGRVESTSPFGVMYEGPPLRSRCRYHWRVRLEDSPGGLGEWSEPAWVETGVLDPALWSAQWVTAAPATVSRDDAAIHLRGSVELTGEVVHGRAYVSGLGWYRFFVNGRDLTGAALAGGRGTSASARTSPGWPGSGWPAPKVRRSGSLIANSSLPMENWTWPTSTHRPS